MGRYLDIVQLPVLLWSKGQACSLLVFSAHDELPTKTTTRSRILTVLKALPLFLIVAALLLAGTESRARAHEAMKIVETLIASNGFHSTVVALRAAGLIETLETNGPFTVFAPNEQAFAKIPHWQLERVLGNKSMIYAITTYHIVPGTLDMTWLRGHPFVAETWKTLNGRFLFLSVEHGTVSVNRKARILSPGITCANGSIFEIDSVLVPYVGTDESKPAVAVDVSGSTVEAKDWAGGPTVR